MGGWSASLIAPMGVPCLAYKAYTWNCQRKLKNGDPGFYKEYPRLVRPDQDAPTQGPYVNWLAKQFINNRSQTAPALMIGKSPVVQAQEVSTPEQRANLYIKSPTETVLKDFIKVNRNTSLVKGAAS